MRDILPDYDRLAASGRPIGRAVVTSVWGSAPRPEGASMPATADGEMAGSVSGGCIEAATVVEIGEAIGRGTPKLVTTAARWWPRWWMAPVWAPRFACWRTAASRPARVPLARALGYRTIVADGRPAFLTRERFPDADELIHAWPEAAFARIGLDTSCFVCVLSHDPKFDQPALELALRSPARYIGAIGSRKTQAARRERLMTAGFTADQIARVPGPIGLDLGGRLPAETALAILAEMTAVRYGGGAVRGGA
jgi:xanthine dehydrogenase accessory factor